MMVVGLYRVLPWEDGWLVDGWWGNGWWVIMRNCFPGMSYSRWVRRAADWVIFTDSIKLSDDGEESSFTQTMRETPPSLNICLRRWGRHLPHSDDEEDTSFTQTMRKTPSLRLWGRHLPHSDDERRHLPHSPSASRYSIIPLMWTKTYLSSSSVEIRTSPVTSDDRDDLKSPGWRKYKLSQDRQNTFSQEQHSLGRGTGRDGSLEVMQCQDDWDFVFKLLVTRVSVLMCRSRDFHINEYENIHIYLYSYVHIGTALNIYILNDTPRFSFFFLFKQRQESHCFKNEVPNIIILNF